ncbi:hypothetical protein Tco_1245261 [Tanacetum coccineum]
MWLRRGDDGGGVAGLSWDSSRRGGESSAWSGGDGGMAAASSGGGVMVTAAAAAMAAVGGMAARGGAWVWGSGRSEWGKYFWYWSEKSPEKFSGGRRRRRRWWPAAGQWWWQAGFGERRGSGERCFSLITLLASPWACNCTSPLIVLTYQLGQNCSMQKYSIV